MTALDFLRLVTIFCAAISAGSLVMGFVMVTRTARKMTPPVRDALYQSIDTLPDSSVRFCAVASAIAALAVLVVQRDLKTFSAILTLVGLAGMVVVIAVSEAGSIPLGRKLSKPSAEAGSADNLKLRLQWDRYNRTRAAAGAFAVICFVLAALVV
jgi:hypothetical protein